MNKYTLNDTNPMPWNEFNEITNKLTQQIKQYFNGKNKSIDAIAPILRSGAIPGTIIANKLQIMTMLPVQVKYNHVDKNPQQLLPFCKPLTENLPTTPNILVVECNTFSGESAKASASIIKNEYPQATLYYATVARVYRNPKINLPIFEEYFYGIETDEGFEANKEAKNSLGIRPRITIFPWETAEFELKDINSTQKIE